MSAYWHLSIHLSIHHLNFAVWCRSDNICIGFKSTFQNRKAIILSLREIQLTMTVDNPMIINLFGPICKTRLSISKTNCAWPVNNLILFKAFFQLFSYLCTRNTSLKEIVTYLRNIIIETSLSVSPLLQI